MKSMGNNDKANPCDKIPNGIDTEIKGLVSEMNKIKGIRTVESCFGHYKNPCQIWFTCDTVKNMNSFLFNYFDCIRSDDWRIEFDVGDVHKEWSNLNLVLVSGSFQKEVIDKAVKDLESRFIEANRISALALDDQSERLNAKLGKPVFVATITLYYNKDDEDIDANKPQYEEECEIIRKGTQFYCPTIKDLGLFDFGVFDSPITLIPKSKKFALNFKNLLEANAIGIKKLEEKK